MLTINGHSVEAYEFTNHFGGGNKPDIQLQVITTPEVYESITGLDIASFSMRRDNVEINGRFLVKFVGVVWRDGNNPNRMSVLLAGSYATDAKPTPEPEMLSAYTGGNGVALLTNQLLQRGNDGRII